ncbi:hypothetical protein B4168_1941 [Anoxybacillus flavithermus]|nr:hypothetical protein B4168_1941 [Anoxybacillus flavithermus]OAO85598.1 hypothetical protein GT23_2501 [Parageobacillus thermoglucosidasius]
MDLPVFYCCVHHINNIPFIKRKMQIKAKKELEQISSSFRDFYRFPLM